jgi:hypothetical protein
MPNHITNVLRINAYEHDGAPAGLVDEILAAVKGDSAFDFERLIPMPKELHISSGGVASDARALFSEKEAKAMLDFPWVKQAGIKSVAALRTALRKNYIKSREDRKRFEEVMGKNEDPPTLDEFAALVLSNHEKHGATDWYDWSIKRWGTKWNAYSVVAGKSDEREATVTFETAWSPPLPVLDELAKRFPKAYLRLIWCDEGDSQQHRVYWENGRREVEGS